jgi:hypothetical protein
MAHSRDGRNSGEPEKELSVRSVRDLLSFALANLPGFPLVLRFRASDDEEGDWSHISQSLPWLHAVGQDGFGTVCENLREHGLAIVICATEEARSRLKILRGRVGREYGLSAGRKRVSARRPRARQERARDGRQ